MKRFFKILSVKHYFAEQMFSRPLSSDAGTLLLTGNSEPITFRRIFYSILAFSKTLEIQRKLLVWIE